MWTDFFVKLLGVAALAVAVFTALWASISFTIWNAAIWTWGADERGGLIFGTFLLAGVYLQIVRRSNGE